MVSAQQLRILRARYRLSQMALAGAVQIPQSHLSRVENGLATFTTEQATRLEEFFTNLKATRKRTHKEPTHA